MKFGASSWPFQWDPPYEDCIKRVAGLGFKAIELIGWNEDFLVNYYTPAKIRDLKACLGDEGLVLSQFASIPHDLSHGDKAKRDAAVELWKRSVGIGAELGAKIIHTVATHPFAMKDTVQIPRITTKPLVQQYATRNVPRGVDWDQNYRDYVDAVRRCATACQDAGVMMALEPHPGRYLANTDGALRLLEHVNSPALGINFDPQPYLPDRGFSEHLGLSAGPEDHPHPRLRQ